MHYKVLNKLNATALTISILMLAMGTVLWVVYGSHTGTAISICGLCGIWYCVGLTHADSLIHKTMQHGSPNQQPKH